MFDKLVLSTKERRQAKASKFVAATSFLYILGLASALVVSIVSAKPGIFEASEIVRLTAVPLPRAESQAQVAHAVRQTNVPKDSIYNVKKFEGLNPQPDKKSAVIPTGFRLDDNAGNESISSTAPGISDVGAHLGTNNSGETEPPLLPPKKINVDPPPQPAPEKQIVRLPSSVLTGKAIERKTPNYPPMAKQIRAQGSVTVEIMIAPDGRVESVRALGGHPLLMQASVEAARGWRFQPTMLNGVPVRVSGVITFNFTLE